MRSQRHRFCLNSTLHCFRRSGRVLRVLFTRAFRCCTASRWSGWGCHQSVPSRTQCHLRARPPGPRGIQVRRRTRLATNAVVRPAILVVALPTSLRGILRNSPAEHGSKRLSLPSLRCVSSRALPSLAISRRCEGYCGTHRRTANDYLSPASESRRVQVHRRQNHQLQAGHRRRHVSMRASRVVRQPSSQCSKAALRCAYSAPPRRVQQRASAPLLRVVSGRRGRCYASLLLPALGLMPAVGIVAAAAALAAASPARGRCRCLLSQPVSPPCCRHRASAKAICSCALLCGEASAEPSAHVRFFCP